MSATVLPTLARRLVATGPRRLEFREDFEVSPPAPGHICIRVERTLISPGTELAKLDGLTGARSGEDWSSNPLPLGYSAAGTVVAVGSHDDPFAVGDRVSASAPHSAFATVKCGQAAALASNVSFEAGTFGTLAALAVHIVRLSALQIGESCAVVGFGLVGQLIALTARLAGARVVAIKEHRDIRVALAQQLGFPLAEQSSAFDVVFESAGTASSLSDALALSVKCGRVIAAGSLREPVSVDVYRDLHAKSVALIGAHGSSQHAVSRVNRWSERENRAAALDFIADGRLPVEKLLTARMPASQALEAFDMLRSRTTNAIALEWT